MILGGNASAVVVEAINLRLRHLVERGGRRREDRAVGVFEVVGLQGHPDGLGGTFHLPGDPPCDLDQACLADWRHPPGSADDLFSLLVAEPLELRPSVDLLLVRLDEPGEAGFEEPDLRSPAHHEPPGHQALTSPPGDRPSRDVVATADLLDRQDRLARLLDRLAERDGKLLDEQLQVEPERPNPSRGKAPAGSRR